MLSTSGTSIPETGARNQPVTKSATADLHGTGGLRRMVTLHRTLLDEHFRIMGRKTFCDSIKAMQKDLDAYLVRYNTEHPYQGRGMKGRTPADVFVQRLPKPNVPMQDTMKKAA